jgi:hypothetical protein
MLDIADWLSLQVIVAGFPRALLMSALLSAIVKSLIQRVRCSQEWASGTIPVRTPPHLGDGEHFGKVC